MAENYFENATGFQVYDALTGELQGGGTFGPNGVTSYMPTMNAPAVSPGLPSGQALINQSFNAAGFSLPTSQPAASPASASSGNAPSPASSAIPSGGGGTPSPGAGPTPATGSGAASSGGGSMSDILSSYFVRGIVVIVGFIFLAIGLHQLSPSVVPSPVPKTP